MKPIIISILLLISIAVFALPQKRKAKKYREQQTIAKIVYESFTRGNRTEVAITKDSVILTNKAGKKFMLNTPAKWNQLTATLITLKLKDIPTWEAPTKAREYDGAAHAKILVSAKGKTYESQYFDAGKPMKQLQPLYDAIDVIRANVDFDGKECL